MKITVSVQTNSTRDRAVILGEHSLKVWLTTKPIKGKANQHLIEFLKKTLREASGRSPVITMEKGGKSTQKVLEVDCNWEIIKKAFIRYQK